MNVDAKQDEFSFCFEDSPHNISSDVRADVINSAKAALTATYKKLLKYVVDKAQPAMPLFSKLEF